MNNHDTTMKPDPQREAALFQAAAQLTGKARASFLDNACAGDSALRQRLDALLAAHEQTEGALADSAPPAAQTMKVEFADPADEVIGKKIGRYKILEKVGEGGCGVVYVAEQTEPVRRRVALKVIKQGMDTKQVVARFEAERQALAMMDHANIAKVLDGGATETGRPYFVMELVRGVRITEYCDQNNLPTKARLHLFIQVCHAIQHAHQKGIIHRDIKPSNILVTLHDGVPVPKVIDFGIAKATEGRLAEHTVHTQLGQFLGTWAYASPEQAARSGLDIDTRSDIYSLGVLLYELLTGKTPFDANRLVDAARDQCLCIICTEEPLRPSTRLSSLTAEEQTTTAKRRNTDPPKLIHMVRGDLDWIVMKSLEKDRTRRYETADGLAMDIQRHLSHQPVVAGPPSAAYRFRKFARRHQVALGVAAGITMLLALGMIGTGLALKRALRAERAERERADELKQVSDFQAGMLDQIDTTKVGVDLMANMRERFDAALAKAGVPESERRAQGEALQNQLARVNATDAAATMIDRTILKPAIKTIEERFKGQPKVDAKLRQALSDLYQTIGLYAAAYPLQKSALETRRRVLGEEHPETLTSTENMGFLLMQQGKLVEAEPYLREALEKSRRVLGEEHLDTIIYINNLGFLLHAQGKLPEAESCYREALRKRRRALGEEHPDTILSIINLGSLLRAQKKTAEAEPYYHEALEKSRRVLGQDHPTTIIAINNRGILLQEQRKYAEAEPYVRESMEKHRRMLGEEHPKTITSIANMGELLRHEGKLAEAEPYLREALEKARRVLGERHFDTLGYVDHLGNLLQAQGKPSGAESEFARGLGAYNPVPPSPLPITAALLHHHADALRALNRLDEAAADAQHALEMYRDHPDWPLDEAAHAASVFGGILFAKGELSQAEPYLREAVEKRGRALGAENPDTISSINTLANVLLLLGKASEAEGEYSRGLAACNRAHSSPQPVTAMFLHHHADALRALKRFDQAEPEARRAVELYSANPDWPPVEASHAVFVLSDILTALERTEEAIRVQRALVAAQRRAPAANRELGYVLTRFGDALLKRHTLESVREAEPLLRECLEIRVKSMPNDWRVPFTRSLLGEAVLTSAELDRVLTTAARADRLREAEPLLLDGYAGLKDNPSVPTPAQIGGFDRRREALERVVRLYEVWDKAEAGQGHDAKAAEWRKRLGANAGPAASSEKKP